MTGLTQEERKRSSPFTLEATLEKEPEVNNSYINDALPFDKCLKADTQVEEAERKKELSRQLGIARTTADQSKKEIREWLGTSIIIKTILKSDFLELIGITISVGGTVGLWNLWLNTLNNTDYPPILLLRGICLTIFIGALMTIGVYSLFSIATTRYNFINHRPLFYLRKPTTLGWWEERCKFVTNQPWFSIYFCMVADDTSPILQAKYPSDQKILSFQYCLDRKRGYFCHR